LKTPLSQIVLVLQALNEGPGVNAVCRLFGVGKNSLYRWPAILILAAFCQPIVIIFHEIAIYCADRGQNENC
jgi:hypothetical protein